MDTDRGGVRHVLGGRGAGGRSMGEKETYIILKAIKNLNFKKLVFIKT